MQTTYMILCREDYADGTQGKYVLATQREFHSFGDAYGYYKSVAVSRSPRIVQVTLQQDEE